MVNQLRLRGRPDLLVRREDGNIAISDDKTGRVVDVNGQVLDKHKMQLWLYALMVEHLTSTPSMTLSVIGESAHAVEWNQNTRDQANSRLKDTHERFEPGCLVSAEHLAVPGKSCRNCRIRPRCSSYRRAAEKWWARTGTPPKPVPFDTWGMLESFQETDSGLGIRLKDDSGRVVRVSGLSQAHGLTASHVGHRVYLYNLQPTQAVKLHGRWLAPTSWHEQPPSRSYAAARTVQVFLE